MFKSTVFKKTIITAAVMVLALVFTFPAYSEETPVNSTDLSAIFFGGLGYGQSSLGSSSGDDLSIVTSVADGPSWNVNLGTLFSWYFIGAELGYTAATFTDMETHFSKEYGSGNLMILDGKLGLRVFTENSDMGYTFFYGGLRYWKATRKVDYRENVGGIVPDSGYEVELSGKGWSAGFRDFSTYPVGPFSIVLQTGIMIYSAPLESIQFNGSKESITAKEDAGVVLEIALGAAFEDIGLSVIGGVKEDNNATVYTVNITSESRVLGLGYRTFFVALTKEISI